MLQGFRKVGQNWFGRIILAVMFGFLIFSFALWGIGDIFRGYGTQTVATIGATEVGADALRTAFQTELQSLSRRYGRTITTEQAVGAGIDRQVLNKLLTEATLDEKVRTIGLALSNDTIVKAIFADPAFKGPNGQFDRARFNDILRQSGYTEAGFIAAQRAVYLRQQMAQSLGGLSVVPAVMQEALNRYINEERSIDFITIGKDQVTPPDAPTDDQLKAYFGENSSKFRAPEYRKITALSLSPVDLANPAAVPDTDIRARYEAGLASVYTTPEKRAVRQIVFQSKDEALAAAARLKNGLSFADLVTERKLKESDTDLGLVAKSAIVDARLADAAFTSEKGAVSDVVDGAFGFVIFTVTEIQPASVVPFEVASVQIRQAIATETTKTALRDLHDKVEDQRSAAKPLADIAQDLKLPLTSVESVDRSGRGIDGKMIDGLAERETLLTAAFSSDVGVDNEAITTRAGGYIWFEVSAITPARDRTLEEVHTEVEAAWREDQTVTRVSAKAAELVASLKAGKALTELAKDLNVPVSSASSVKRNGQAAGLSQAVIAQTFSVAANEAASAVANNPSERVVLLVTKSALPSTPQSLPEVAKIDNQLKLSLSDDYISAYINRTQTDLGLKINDAVVGLALGLN